MHYRIRDLNGDEKPREKLLNLGVNKLTNEELLALIIRTGGRDLSAIDLSRIILNKVNGLAGLTNSAYSLLTSIKYVNAAKACAIIASQELSKRVLVCVDVKRQPIKRPQDVFRVIQRHTLGKTKEHLYLISLDARNRVISIDLISLGSVNETIVNPREVFQKALQNNAVSIIIVHNHPSNDPQPSNEDIIVTEQVAKAGKELNVPLLDHVIVTNTKYISLKHTNLFSTFNKNPKGGDKESDNTHQEVTNCQHY